MRRTLLIVYLLETGLVLVVAPWSTFWDRNLLVESFPFLGGFALSAMVRGGVSGVGIVTLYAGAWELLSWLRTVLRRPGSGRSMAGPQMIEARSDALGRKETSPCAPER